MPGASANVGQLELPSHLFYEEDSYIKTKKDVVILDELKPGVQSEPINITVVDTETEQESILTLPTGTEILINSDQHAIIKANQTIAKLSEDTTNIVSVINHVTKILESQMIRTYTWRQVYQELLKHFGDLGVLSIWYEILVSQIMRDPDDPTRPWRLAPDRHSKEPLLMTIRQIPFLRPFLAIAFQNIGKSLSFITERMEIDIHQLTIMERIFSSKF